MLYLVVGVEVHVYNYVQFILFVWVAFLPFLLVRKLVCYTHVHVFLFDVVGDVVYTMYCINVFSCVLVL